MSTIGSKRWAIPGGHIPLRSTGHEPEFTSRDQLHLLNTSDADASVVMVIYYSDRDPAGPYSLQVPARRVRVVRFNDLIDPQAIPLECDYACVLTSDVPIVVQFTRQDTSQAENAVTTTIGFAAGT